MPDAKHARGWAARLFTRERLQAIAPFAVLLLISGVFLLLTTGYSTRLTQSFHGLYHAAYATQLANGIVPPTNPSSIGMPANYYWIWHGLLALLSRGAGITVFQAHLIVSWLSLTTFLGALWVFSGRRAWSWLSRLGACFLPFFILDPVGLSHYALLAVSASGVPGAATPSVVHLMPVPELFGIQLHPIAGHLLNKMCNFSSFPAALALYAIALLALARPGSLRTRCAVLFVCAALSVLFSPLPAAGIAGAAVAFTFVRWVEGQRGAALWAPAAATAAGILAALPYLLSLARAFGSEIHLFLEPAALGRHALRVGWPLAAAAPAYLLGALWFRSLTTEERAWGILGLGCSLVAMLVAATAETPNEYKFILLTALPSALLTLAIARELGSRLPLKPGFRRTLRALSTLLLLAGAGSSLGATTALYRGSAWAKQNPYSYADRHIDLAPASHPKRQALANTYHWLREHTAPTAFVLERPVHGNDVLIPMIAERRVVAVKLWHHNRAVPHQRQLERQAIAVSRGLETCKVSPSELNKLFRVPAPWPETLYAVAPIRAAAETSACKNRLDPRITIAYQNGHFRVFSIRRRQ